MLSCPSQGNNPVAVSFDKFDEEKERECPGKMSDEQLMREGKAARYMCAPFR